MVKSSAAALHEYGRPEQPDAVSLAVAARHPKVFYTGGLPPRRLRDVLDFMRDNLKSDIDIKTIAALAGLSRAQFFRAFKRSTGISPYRYLTDARLCAAKTLLRSQRLSCGEVAVAVGMPNQAVFGALFRNRFGTTPRAFAMMPEGPDKLGTSSSGENCVSRR